jgi:phosphoadenosine phosphosulfate reductase
LNYRNNQQSINGLQEQYIQESIDFIREHEPPEGYFVGFSGGKDSIVTLELVKMSGVKFEAYYSCTGIDPPEIYRFIRINYPEVIWKYPKISFWEGIRKKGIPFRQRRWCCDVLKKDPTKNIPLTNRIMGIRAEESNLRANRGIISSYNKITTYKPIFNWLEWQIWEFIEGYRFPYPSLYDDGFDRIGCVICPFLSRRKKEIAMKRWPKQYQIFEKVVKAWWETRTVKNYSTADEFLEFWYGK